jgi:hypothetical protein
MKEVDVRRGREKERREWNFVRKKEIGKRKRVGQSRN